MASAVLQHPEARPTDSKGEAVDTKSLAHPTRTIFTDDRFFEEVSELTGVTFGALHRAFVGKEKNLALEVVKTAVAENPHGTPEEWQQRVLAWAKANRSGEYRPGYWDDYELTYEYNEFLRSIGRL